MECFVLLIRRYIKMNMRTIHVIRFWNRYESIVDIVNDFGKVSKSTIGFLVGKEIENTNQFIFIFEYEKRCLTLAPRRIL